MRMCTYSFDPAPELSTFASAKGSAEKARWEKKKNEPTKIYTKQMGATKNIQFSSPTTKKESIPKVVGVERSESDMKLFWLTEE